MVLQSILFKPHQKYTNYLYWDYNYNNFYNYIIPQFNKSYI